MKFKAVSGIMLTLLFIGMLTLEINIQPVKASGTIYIRADGSVEPSTANITSADNVTYYFTGNNYDEIVVERSNIIIDGNGYTLQGSGGYYSKGIDLTGRSNVTIKNMKIRVFGYGIHLYSSSNNTVSGNNITENNYYGISLEYSPNNTISGNNITNNEDGIWLSDSSNDNRIYGNKITANSWTGIWLSDSLNNTIHGNDITATEWDGMRISGSYNSISGNNITNNGQGMSLSGSYNSISGNNITENIGYGIELLDSSNNTVSGNNMTNNGVGIELSSSSNNNSITKNNITASEWGGIRLWWSSSNTIYRNDITNNSDGIYLHNSSNNTIYGNDITNNNYGIVPTNSSNNIIYHNNIINNTQQVYIYTSGCANVWDNGYPSGGNYWSDHSCTGNPSDGSQPYIIDANNIDHYPFQDPNGWLLPPPVHVFEVVWDSEVFYVSVESNSTVSNFYFSQPTKEIGFNVTGPDGTIGFCNVTIPKELLWCDNIEQWMTLIDGLLPLYLVATENETHTMLYFTYLHTIHQVQIFGTHVIGPPPEYTLTIYSLPTGVTFTVDGAPRTTPWSETYSEGVSVSLVMPENHDGYSWSHWLEDGDPNRIKTVTVDTNITLTGVFTLVPPPPPVGGKGLPINIPVNKPELQIPWIWLTTIILSLVAMVVYVKKRKRNTRMLPYAKC